MASLTELTVLIGLRMRERLNMSRRSSTSSCRSSTTKIAALSSMDAYGFGVRPIPIIPFESDSQVRITTVTEGYEGRCFPTRRIKGHQFFAIREMHAKVLNPDQPGSRRLNTEDAKERG